MLNQRLQARINSQKWLKLDPIVQLDTIKVLEDYRALKARYRLKLLSTMSTLIRVNH